MHRAYVMTGTVADGRTVVLDEPLPMASARVRVTVEVLDPLPHTYEGVLVAIRKRQRERGHTAPLREEIDDHLRAEQESWDET